VRLAAGDEAVRQRLAAAIRQVERVELVYHGRARGTTTRPVVDPAAIEVADGVAYLSAFSVTAQGWRTYRLDRIAQVSPTGQAALAHPGRPGANAWAESLANSAVVRLGVDGRASWIAEYYPTRQVERLGDTWVVTLPVVDPAWLVRLVLSLGPAVTSVDPPQYAEIARGLARQALAAYDQWAGADLGSPGSGGGPGEFGGV
jgi:proteasome accessory factor C